MKRALCSLGVLAMTGWGLLGCETVVPEPTRDDTRTQPPTTATASAAATGSAAASAAPTGSASSPAADTAGAPASASAASAAATGSAAPLAAAEPNPKLFAPDKAKDKAPAAFKVKLSTTKGDFVVECHRDWSPHGVDRFYNLAKVGFFTDVALFRAVENFVVQFGIHGTPKVAAAWADASIPDDPVKQGNKRGRLTFAKSGPNTRSTQLFINYKDNDSLDSMGFPALCEVTGDGMKVVDSFFKGYGEETTSKQGLIQSEGNAYLRKSYPDLDYIKSAALLEDGKPGAGAALRPRLDRPRPREQW